MPQTEYICPYSWIPVRLLKVASRLQRDNAGSERLSCLSEVRRSKVVRNATVVASVAFCSPRIEVQAVEEVVGIDTEFDLSVFTEHRHIRETKTFRQGAVDVFIAWPGE